jgi:SET domain-containing protein
MLEVEVKLSKIEGLGVFATRSFKKDDRIRRVNIVREVTPATPLRAEFGELADHCSYPDGKILLWGYPDRHVNHSCDPNSWLLYEAEDCYFVTRRDIAIGEEITCDYIINVADGSPWPCRCKSVRCRGAISGGFFDLPIERQREYLPFLAEWFVRNNHERLAAMNLH